MNQLKPTSTSGTLGDSFLGLLLEAENLKDKFTNLMTVSAAMPTTLEEINKLIELANKNSSKVISNTSQRNIAVFDKEIKNAKNYIPETDFFFV